MPIHASCWLLFPSQTENSATLYTLHLYTKEGVGEGRLTMAQSREKREGSMHIKGTVQRKLTGFESDINQKRSSFRNEPLIFLF
jgi:hypothetical protein